MKQQLTMIWVGAPWCKACCVGKPAALAHCLSNNIVFDELCAEEDSAKVGPLGVESLPTAILYADGVELTRWTGAFQQPKIAKMISDSVNS